MSTVSAVGRQRFWCIWRPRNATDAIWRVLCSTYILPFQSLPQQNSQNFCIFRVAKNYSIPFRPLCWRLGHMLPLPPTRRHCTASVWWAAWSYTIIIMVGVTNQVYDQVNDTALQPAMDWQLTCYGMYIVCFHDCSLSRETAQQSILCLK